MRFVFRSNELVNEKIGRSAIGVEKICPTPSYTYNKETSIVLTRRREELRLSTKCMPGV